MRKLPWGHVRTLLDRLDDRADREWYATCAVDAGWSRKSLEHHVATGLRQRIGSAPSNFPTLLDSADSDLAQEIVKDPYIFDFLNLTQRSAERDLEQALMNRLSESGSLVFYDHGWDSISLRSSRLFRCVRGGLLECPVRLHRQWHTAHLRRREAQLTASVAKLTGFFEKLGSVPRIPRARIHESGGVGGHGAGACARRCRGREAGP